MDLAATSTVVASTVVLDYKANTVTAMREANWGVLRAQVQACLMTCQACGVECERHAGHMEHCRGCAAACRACEQA